MAAKKISIIYITFPDQNSAKKLATLLLEAKLIACVNILKAENAMYRWEGKLVDDQEWIIIAKTKSSLVDEITKYAKQNHPYSCPCILSWEISIGNNSYIDWVYEETKDN